MDKPNPVRLADYFVVLSLNSHQEQCGVGSIAHRFPDADWPDNPLSGSLQMFTSPHGWELTTEKQDPTYFVCTLTDIMGAQQYACCLQVQEEVDDIDVDVELAVPATSVFRPKILVIVSRYAYFDLFRNCLNRIYAAIVNNNGGAEQMIATIVSGVRLCGRTPITFALNGERLSVRPMSQTSVPITGDRVAQLVKQLGSIHNLLLVMRSLICDLRMILISSSKARLADTAYAIRCLLFPFEYSYTFVPVLPDIMHEYLESPTPYIMGVFKQSLPSLPKVEAVLVDLDIGSVIIPEATQLAAIPEPFYSRLVASLQQVLSPGLASADKAVPPSCPPQPQPEHLDKLVRACFLRFFMELLYGYRTCLELVRLHRKPLIVFHKAAFMGARCLSGHPFIRHLLGSQMFQMFIASRGLPYRPCDMFDEWVNTSNQIAASETSGKTEMMENIQQLADLFLENEYQEVPFSTPIRPSEMLLTNGNCRMRGSSVETNGDVHLDTDRINQLIAENMKKEDLITPETLKPRTVPEGTLNIADDHLSINSRRLEVLTTCIKAIFDNRLADARKMLCAVELSLRALSARLALCQQLSAVLNPIHRGTLSPQQFDLVVRLMNCALDHESPEDEHGIAYACLYLSHVYCRPLGTGVHQFAYTCIQEHPVWLNQDFWQAAFFHDVHQLMRRQYMCASEKLETKCNEQNYLFSTKSRFDMWNLMEEPTAMQIVAARLEQLDTYNDDDLSRWSSEEESIVYGQAKHYINLMVYLRVPLDPSRLRRINKSDLESRGNYRPSAEIEDDASSQMTESESGVIENVNDGDWGAVIVKWISRLIDRICSEASLDPKLTDRLQQDIPGFVAVHIDNLEQVYYESKKFTSIPKSELPMPVLYSPSEKVIVPGLRAFLLPNQQKLEVGAASVAESSMCLLPAEGALFLTNYRIIFKGSPVSPLLNDQTVIRTIPIMALVKDKNISDSTLQTTGQLAGIPSKVAGGLHSCLQFRSSCFQLVQVVFDEEVAPNTVEELSKTLSALRWPQSLPHTLYAYSSSAHLLEPNIGVGTRPKYNTIRDFKKNIFKGSLMRKTPSQTLVPQQRTIGYTFPNKPIFFNDSVARQTPNSDYLDLSEVVSTASDTLVNPLTMPDTHRQYIKDYDRLGFGPEGTPFRISFFNSQHDVVKTYPSTLIVPAGFADDVLHKVAKGFKHGRFPVISWVSASGAMIIRGSGLNSNIAVVQRIKMQGKTISQIKEQGSQMITSLMHQPEIPPSFNKGSKQSVASKDSGSSGPQHSTEVQEMYLSRLALISPSSTAGEKELLSGSLSSLLSVDSGNTDGMSISTNTPEQTRARLPTMGSMTPNRLQNMIRNSGGKGGRTLPARPEFASAAGAYPKLLMEKRTPGGSYVFKRKNLYIFGDKGNAKSIRLDANAEFVPLTYASAHQLKVSFKKMLRVLCPGWGVPDGNFYSVLDETQWMQHVSNMLSISMSMASIVELYNSSVALCLEEGWDVTAVISSLSQLLLDPFYRTLEGFRILVEKEWLAFGHRFSHRANHTIGSQGSGLAPVFLLFLDCVHQLAAQFPAAFQFSSFYIKFLAYHSQSAYYRTFLLDCEADRIRIDQAAPDTTPQQIMSIWNDIEVHCQTSVIFFNPLYSPTLFEVLHPSTSLGALSVWDYYTEDFLSHGSPYDLEVALTELAQGNAESVSRGEAVPHRAEFVDAERVCADLLCKNKFGSFFEHMVSAADDGGTAEAAIRAISTMSDSDIAAKLEEQYPVTTITAWDGQLQRLLCKKAIVRLLVRSVGVQSAINNTPHRVSSVPSHHFEHYSGPASQDCAVCNISLLPEGTVKKCLRCRICRQLIHERCQSGVYFICSVGGNAPAPDTDRTLKMSNTMESIGKPETRTLTTPNGHHVNHQGYLHKKGATFKLWKPRWFVLNAVNHKLVYYDSEHDTVERGSIDLCEVRGVEVTCHGAPAKRAVLELITSKRTYSLLADSLNDAETWKERIEWVLRE